MAEKEKKVCECAARVTAFLGYLDSVKAFAIDEKDWDSAERMLHFTKKYLDYVETDCDVLLPNTREKLEVVEEDVKAKRPGFLRLAIVGTKDTLHLEFEKCIEEKK